MQYWKKTILPFTVIVIAAFATFAMPFISDVTLNSDDGTELDQSTWIENGINDSYNRIGNGSTDVYNTGFRFHVDALNCGDEVAFARLRFSAKGGKFLKPLDLIIQGVLQQNPETFSQKNRPSRMLPKTLTKVPWIVHEGWLNSGIWLPLWYSSPDVAGIVNEILDLPGWGSGPEEKTLVLDIMNRTPVPGGNANFVQFADFNYGAVDFKCPVSLEIYKTVYDTFVGKELLGRPRDRSITVSCYSLIETDTFVEYGTSPGIYFHCTRIFENNRAGEPIEMVVDDLMPDTHYHYRLRYRKASSSGKFEAGEEHAFHTKRRRGASFSFAVQADEHLQGMHKRPGNIPDQQLYKTTLRNIFVNKPDFLISLGDFAHTEYINVRNATTLTDAKERYLLQRRYIDEIAHSIPFFLVIGNHEGEQAWYDHSENEKLNSLAFRSVTARKAIIPNPFPDGFYSGNPAITSGTGLREDYYAWEWGDALFVVLNPYCATKKKPHGAGHAGEGWLWTLGREQYEWLHDTLHSSDATWKFCFLHQLVSTTGAGYGRGGIEVAKYKVDSRASYEWGGEDEFGNDLFSEYRPGWCHGPIHDMLVNEEVAIVFHGHDHFFAKQDLDGIVYLECPQPGSTNYGFGYKGVGKYTYGDFLPNSGHVEVNVDPSMVKIEYIRAYLPGHGTNGEVAYSHTIMK